jgi:hypothetical protein
MGADGGGGGGESGYATALSGGPCRLATVNPPALASSPKLGDHSAAATFNARAFRGALTLSSEAGASAIAALRCVGREGARGGEGLFFHFLILRESESSDPPAPTSQNVKGAHFVHAPRASICARAALCRYHSFAPPTKSALRQAASVCVEVVQREGRRPRRRASHAAPRLPAALLSTVHLIFAALLASVGVRGADKRRLSLSPSLRPLFLIADPTQNLFPPSLSLHTLTATSRLFRSKRRRCSTTRTRMRRRRRAPAAPRVERRRSAFDPPRVSDAVAR